MHDFEIYFNSLLPTIVSNIGNTSIYYKNKTDEDEVTAASLDSEIASSASKISHNFTGKKRVKIIVPGDHPSK